MSDVRIRLMNDTLFENPIHRIAKFFAKDTFSLLILPLIRGVILPTLYIIEKYLKVEAYKITDYILKSLLSLPIIYFAYTKKLPSIINYERLLNLFIKVINHAKLYFSVELKLYEQRNKTLLLSICVLCSS